MTCSVFNPSVALILEDGSEQCKRLASLRAIAFFWGGLGCYIGSFFND